MRVIDGTRAGQQTNDAIPRLLRPLALAQSHGVCSLNCRLIWYIRSAVLWKTPLKDGILAWFMASDLLRE